MVAGIIPSAVAPGAVPASPVAPQHPPRVPHPRGSPGATLPRSRGPGDARLPGPRPRAAATPSAAPELGGPRVTQALLPASPGAGRGCAGRALKGEGGPGPPRQGQGCRQGAGKAQAGGQPLLTPAPTGPGHLPWCGQAAVGCGGAGRGGVLQTPDPGGCWAAAVRLSPVLPGTPEPSRPKMGVLGHPPPPWRHVKGGQRPPAPSSSPRGLLRAGGRSRAGGLLTPPPSRPCWGPCRGVPARYLLLLLRVSLPLLTGPAVGPGWPGWLRVMRPLGGCAGVLGGCAGPPGLSPFPFWLSGAGSRGEHQEEDEAGGTPQAGGAGWHRGGGGAPGWGGGCVTYLGVPRGGPGWSVKQLDWRSRSGPAEETEKPRELGWLLSGDWGSCWCQPGPPPPPQTHPFALRLLRHVLGVGFAEVGHLGVHHAEPAGRGWEGGNGVSHPHPSPTLPPPEPRDPRPYSPIFCRSPPRPV